MDLGVGLVLIVLVVAPPILWVMWWLLADLGEKANGSGRPARLEVVDQWRRRAA